MRPLLAGSCAESPPACREAPSSLSFTPDTGAAADGPDPRTGEPRRGTYCPVGGLGLRADRLLVLSLLSRWSAVVGELEAALKRVFYPDAVEEWLEENVHPSLQRLQALLQDLHEAASPRPDSGQDP